MKKKFKKFPLISFLESITEFQTSERHEIQSNSVRDDLKGKSVIETSGKQHCCS